MIFSGWSVSRLVGQDVVIANDWSQSESIGWCRRVQGGLILCYAQALGVVGVGSLYTHNFKAEDFFFDLEGEVCMSRCIEWVILKKAFWFCSQVCV